MCADRLETYRQKRDFSRTKEPDGTSKKPAKTSGKKSVKKSAKTASHTSKRTLGYLIQKHDASHVHYDFRLEHDGVLLSFACPKGPSLDPADKRLAVHVEDHPIAYGGFEGTIPKGEYGGGTVMLWDQGTWTPHGDVDEGLAEGKLKFALHGERLHGDWAMVRLRSRGKKDRGRDNWLLIKEHDDEMRVGETPIVESELTSAASGRTMEEIAQGGDIWHSRQKGAKLAEDADAKPANAKLIKAKASKRAAKKASSKTPTRKPGPAHLPPFVAPQLATLVDAAPTEKGWLHEIKYDGYRAIVSLGDDSVLIRTRTGLDWTDKLASLVEPLSQLPCSSALLDGEIVVADAEGHTNFGALQDAISNGSANMAIYLFDLLSLDGADLKSKPLTARKAALAKLLKGLRKNSPVLYSDHIAGDGAPMFAHACKMHLEGIISKKADAPYRSGRGGAWLKTKCGMAQEFVIIGWRPSDKTGRGFSSILLALREKGKLRYCGRVGSGFNETQLEDMAAKFKKLARKTPPVDDVPSDVRRQAHFVEPELVAEISFRGWTREGAIRQGSFKGLRIDKPAKAIAREKPEPVREAVAAAAKKSVTKTGKKTVKKIATKKATKKASKASEKTTTTTTAKAASSVVSSKHDDEIAGVRVTHPDRVVFADQGVTKRALAEYYVGVSDLMLPYVAGRPLSLVRCPQGSAKQCFFQKHASPGWPDLFRTVKIKEKSGSDAYLYIEDTAGLVAAAQMGALELHIWDSHVDHLEEPDRLVFDFDPDDGLPFAKVKDAANEMRDRLQALKLTSFAMITGGKGVHVVVPLAPRHTWDQHKAFAEGMARLMAEDDPARYLAVMSKAQRKGKIFIDYLRNGRGATAIAPYSTRARAGAFIAQPVSWAALGKLKSAQGFHVGDNVKTLTRGKDPWAGYHDVRQALPKV